MTGFVEVLRKSSCARLLGILDSIEGKKDLILDAELIGTLDYVAKVQQLKACKIEKIFKLEPGSAPGNTSRCVYLIRSSLESTRIIADHIKANKNAGKEYKYWIIYVSKKWALCDMILEREGVYGYVEIRELPLGLIPIDSDMFSLELADFFPSCFLYNNQIHLHTVATSLVQIQELYGCIPKIFGHGKYSEMVIDMMKTLMKESPAQSRNGEISHLIIFDRDIDYVSVLLTQLNYEGLLDETFNIKSGSITFGKEATGQDQPVKIILNNDDSIYSTIRNCHFTSVLGILKAKAQQLQMKNFQDKRDLSVDDMKQIIAHKRTFKDQERLLPLYIHTCEVIIREKNVDFQKHLTTEHSLVEGVASKENYLFIEDSINMQVPLFSSLRLLCLLSVTQDGVSQKDYNSLVTQFLQSYGHKYMITIHNLKKLGLFIEQAPITLSVASNVTATKLAGRVAAAVAFPRQSSYKVIAKKMLLVPNADVIHDLKTPTDMSYVYSGAYTPLIGKLTEQIIQNDGFTKLEDTMKLLPGSTINYVRTIAPDNTPNKIIMVFVLGGITYAETSALRLLAKIKGLKILIATTAIINGNSLMSMLIPRDPI